MTTHNEPAESRNGRASVRRRRFLGGLGASGLATAAAVFGGARAANAYTAGCCALAYSPTMSVSQCVSNARYYMWTCSNPQYPGDRLHACDCCEAENSSGQYYASAFRCYP